MKKAIPDHITIFSPSQVELMLEALNELDVYFDRINHPVPNVDFAKDTVIILRGKLRNMVRERKYTHYFGMDVNEVLLLHTALTLFFLTLKDAGISDEKRHMRSNCLVLIAHFAPMLLPAGL